MLSIWTCFYNFIHCLCQTTDLQAFWWDWGSRRGKLSDSLVSCRRPSVLRPRSWNTRPRALWSPPPCSSFCHGPASLACDLSHQTEGCSNSERTLLLHLDKQPLPPRVVSRVHQVNLSLSLPLAWRPGSRYSLELHIYRLSSRFPNTPGCSWRWAPCLNTQITATWRCTISF